MGPEQNLIGTLWFILTKLIPTAKQFLGYVLMRVKHFGNKKPPLFSEGLL